MGSIGLSNGHTDLPNRNSPDIHLVIGTQEENDAQQKVNSTEWRGALSEEAYLRREGHLSNQDLTRDGGLTGWALVYQPEGSSKRQVLCGCETIRKKALVGKNGKVEEVAAHGVGSVFCPQENRGKGYAARMMAELGMKLENWQMNDGKRVLFSVLYSDIGKQFYARNGWQPFPSSHVALASAAISHIDLPYVRQLKSEDVPELCDIDSKLTRQRLAKQKDSSRSAVALIPDVATIRWHHAREEFIGNELFKKTPVIKGAVTGEVGARVWCYWTRVWTNPQEEAPNTLHILRLVVEDQNFSDFAPASEEGVANVKTSRTAKSIAALFTSAQAQAAEWKMGEVQIWNPTSTTLAATRLLDDSSKVDHRENESITSLRWYGEGSWENVDWVCNEKYGWC